MAGQLVQHVVQKRHTSAHLTLAAAVEVELHLHICFAGDPVHLALAGGGHGGDSVDPMLAALAIRSKGWSWAPRGGWRGDGWAPAGCG